MEKIVKQPVPLQLLAQLVILINTCRPLPTQNTQVYEQMKNVRQLPKLLLDQQLLMRKCGGNILFVFIRSETQEVISDLLANAAIEHLPEALELFDLFLPYVDIRVLLEYIEGFMEIKDEVLEAIVGYIDEYTMLNNMMILATVYNRVHIIDICISKGANDFVTAQKAAALHCRRDLINFYANARESPAATRFRHTHEYINYFLLRDAAHNTNPFTRYLVSRTFESNLELYSGYPADDTPEFFEDLDTPMCTWSSYNLFKHICYLRTANILRLVESYHRNNPTL